MKNVTIKHEKIVVYIGKCMIILRIEILKMEKYYFDLHNLSIFIEINI